MTFILRRCGGTGRRKGLKIPRLKQIVPVRSRSAAPFAIGPPISNLHRVRVRIKYSNSHSSIFKITEYVQHILLAYL